MDANLKKRRICAYCGKRPAVDYGDLCSVCEYQHKVAYEMDQDPDDRDWSFAVCEECGRSLSSEGICTNTWCGNSPLQGTDWL